MGSDCFSPWKHNSETKRTGQSQRVINYLDNVDFIPSNVQSSHQEALLYVFEDPSRCAKQYRKCNVLNVLSTCLLNPCNVVAQWSHHSLVQ